MGRATNAITAKRMWGGNFSSLYPQPVLDRMEASTTRMVQTVERRAAQQAGTLLIGGR